MPKDTNSANSDVGKWHGVLDKNTGRTYYYNDITKKTTWDKPFSLQTPEERRQAAADLAERTDFFAAMESTLCVCVCVCVLLSLST